MVNLDRKFLNQIKSTDVLPPVITRKSSTEKTMIFTINTNLLNYTTKQGLINLLMALKYLPRSALVEQVNTVYDGNGMTRVIYNVKEESYDPNLPSDCS